MPLPHSGAWSSMRMAQHMVEIRVMMMVMEEDWLRSTKNKGTNRWQQECPPNCLWKFHIAISNHALRCDSNLFSLAQQTCNNEVFKWSSLALCSGKSKWWLTKWALKVLVLNCPRLPTIVVILRRQFLLESGPKRPQKVHNCRRLCTNCREWPETLLEPLFILPVPLQKLVGDFFYFSQGNLVGNLARILRDLFWPTE